MIGEADIMKPRFMKTKHNYPKYFIIREIDEWDFAKILFWKLLKNLKFFIKK